MSSTDHFIIVVGVDFSALSGLALDQALEMATLHEGAEVHAVFVQPDAWTGVPPEGSPQAMVDTSVALRQVQENAAEHVARMPSSLAKTRLRHVVAHFRHGSPAQNVAQLASDLDADLVVVGSHGHRGVERFFLGSVAERISRLAHCPVLIVRPKDHSNAGRVPRDRAHLRRLPHGSPRERRRPDVVCAALRAPPPRAPLLVFEQRDLRRGHHRIRILAWRVGSGAVPDPRTARPGSSIGPRRTTP